MSFVSRFYIENFLFFPFNMKIEKEIRTEEKKNNLQTKRSSCSSEWASPLAFSTTPLSCLISSRCSLATIADKGIPLVPCNSFNLGVGGDYGTNNAQGPLSFSGIQKLVPLLNKRSTVAC